MSKITYINKSSCIIKNVKFQGTATIGPNTTLIDTEIGDKVEVCNSTISHCKISHGTKVNSSQIEESVIGQNCEIGPYTHIRPQSNIKDNCRIGNFVEIKKSQIDSGTKISHMSYVGDATIGKNVNVGCGVIFANYDGVKKHHTIVGDNVFIGSNCNIIAPVTIEDDVFVAAGSTVTQNLSKNAFCIARAKETIKQNYNNNYAKKFQKTNSFFGTDGIRMEGSQQEFFELGKLIGLSISSKKIQKIVLGRDTRPSGKIIRDGILQGLNNAHVFDLGIVSTPCVAFETCRQKADLGIVITASHNPKSFNGVKFFDGNGQKLSSNEECLLEKKLEENFNNFIKINQKNEKKYTKNLILTKINPQKYISHIINFASQMQGLEIAVDVSGGPAGTLAQKVFKKLGINAHIIGRSKFHDINQNCGCLHLDNLKSYMKEHNIPIGFAFDGDADRVLAIDEKLEVVDGDKLLFVLAKELKKQNKLKNNCIVATQMSNLALVQALKDEGISTSLTAVGDKYVIEEMNHLDASLGGEQSGHIITKGICGSGDGLLISVLISNLVYKSKQPLHTLAKLDLYPQFQHSFLTSKAQEILNSSELQEKISKLENDLKGGRILVRKSGTEAKLRVLVEAKNKRKAKKVFEELKKLIDDMC